VAAHTIAPQYEALLQQLVAVESHVAAAPEAAGGAGAGPGAAPPQPPPPHPQPAGGAAGGASPSAPASATAPRPSLHLLAAAARGVTLSNLLRQPRTVSAWTAQLARRRDDEARFPRRLHLYAALNLVRQRALLKATGRWVTALQLCGHYLDGSAEAAAAVIRRFMLADDPRRMLALLAWACGERDVRRRRYEELAVFDRLRFSGELSATLEYLVTPLNRTRHLVGYVLAWESPPLSGALLAGALALAAADALASTLPLVLLLHAGVLVTYAALPESGRARLAAVLGRERGAQASGLLERLRNFRANLGANQARLHALNRVVLKARSLYTWRDPPRTWAFLVVLVCGAALTAVVPGRALFTLVVLTLFSKPLRSPDKGLVGVALQRWWDGLPVPSAADAVYEGGGQVDPGSVLGGGG
jgi:hypothetical protein